MKDLGINSDSINYEVALEFLGQSRQPLMQDINDERAKSAPCEAYIRYCEARLRAIDDLQDDLMPEDKETITKILNNQLTFRC